MRQMRLTKEQAMVVLARHGLDTREGALAAYGDRVAAKWGEAEREHGLRQQRVRSHGLIANAVVVFDPEAIDEELRAAVRHLLTPADLAQLRHGG